MSIHNINVVRRVWDDKVKDMVTVHCILTIDTDRISSTMIHKARTNKSGQSKLGPITLRRQGGK